MTVAKRVGSRRNATASLRRLFDRLVALGAVRELSGRLSFRLYGLEPWPKPNHLPSSIASLPTSHRHCAGASGLGGEAVIFASPKPVRREDLAKVVGESANLDIIIDDIKAELVDRLYDPRPSLNAQFDLLVV